MKFFNSTVVLSSIITLAIPVPTLMAQSSDDGGGEEYALEEITVTGRKRDETLEDVPVSISVLTAEALQDQGIISQDDLFAATVGLDYNNFNGTRFGNNPGVRGVQSDLRASNQQKVASFIDSMPMLGGTGELQFSGIDAVEVYRGPQSAAFGRSTFAGAVNYVTADATEEFEAKIQGTISDQGQQQIGGRISGPLGDKLGYRLSYNSNDWDAPGEFTSTDGLELGSTKTDFYTGKLNFEFTDSVYGEVMYTRLESDDGPGSAFVADISTCDASSGIWRFNMGTDVQLPSGKWDCPSTPPAGGIPRNHDVLGQFVSQFDANQAAYAMTIMGGIGMLDTNMDGQLSASEYLAQTFVDGQTYEQALLGQTVDPTINLTRDRVQGEMNFEIGDHLLKVMGMYTDESSETWFEVDNGDSLAVILMGMVNMNIMSMLMQGTIEEKYVEARWVSPGENRFRYTLSGSYYDYDLQSQVYNNGGAVIRGLTLPNGGPVNPQSGITISEVAENIGGALGLQYDFNDSLTLSFEARYQVDEVCGVDRAGANVKLCQETKSFLPRVALNNIFENGNSVYAQVSLGNNPAGVNIWGQDPGNILALQVASGQIPVPAVGPTGIAATNAGCIYDGVTPCATTGGPVAQEASYDATTFSTFEEEELINIEIGSKGSYLDGRGVYTVAAYWMEWEGNIGAENLNWDNTDPGGWNENDWTTFTGERTWINQGDAELYGIEIDTQLALNETFTVGGNVSVASSKFKDLCSIQAPEYRMAPGGAMGMGANPIPILTPAADGVPSNCGVVDGNWIPRQSEVTGNVNVIAYLPDMFGLDTNIRADVRHKGSFFEDHLNLIERKAVTTLNLSANMRNENWNIRIFANNVFDNDEPLRIAPLNDYSTRANPATPTAFAGSWSIVPQNPREVGVQVGYTFRGL